MRRWAGLGYLVGGLAQRVDASLHHRFPSPPLAAAAAAAATTTTTATA
eukprot:COSAG01_NODE_8080_length_2929_cov_23.547350_6_plen_47_part_01